MLVRRAGEAANGHRTGPSAPGVHEPAAQIHLKIDLMKSKDGFAVSINTVITGCPTSFFCSPHPIQPLVVNIGNKLFRLINGLISCYGILSGIWQLNR